MRKNRVVQTGPKSHEGGFQDGLIRSVRYQVLTEVKVAILPIIPAPSAIKIQKINLSGLNFDFNLDFIIKV